MKKNVSIKKAKRGAELDIPTVPVIINGDVQAVNENHGQCIAEYFRNGFSMVKAVMTVNPHLTYNGGNSIGQAILKHPGNKAYIQAKQEEVKASTNIESSQLVRELLTIGYGDVTDYIELSAKELKELPPEVRRCIASIKQTKKTYKDRQGMEVTEVRNEIKLKDSLKAFDMLSKYCGLYEQDNKQRAATVNLTNINTEQLNVLLQVATKALEKP